MDNSGTTVLIILLSFFLGTSVTCSILICNRLDTIISLLEVLVE